MPIDDPTSATPSEIDAELARLHADHARAQDTLRRLAKRHQDLLNDGMPAYAAELQPRIEQAHRTVAACEAAARPLDAEFERRGGWTRAWLVLNTGGHVHRTTQCRTCFVTTNFAWLTHLSGHDETEIIEQSGESACTECYPSAPVDIRKRPSRIKTPEQLAREAEKAEREKAKAVKAITAPDGTPLRTNHYGRIDTEFTARRSYVDAVSYARYLNRGDVARHRDTIAQYAQDARLILAALAAKHGRTEEDLKAELAPKVEAKWKRSYSRWH